MKIALLLHKYFPYGGLQRDCLRMAMLLVEQGVSVTIVTRTWSGDRPEGIEVECLGSRGWTNLAMDKNFDQDLAAWLSEREFDRAIGFSRLAVDVDYYYAADPCYVERVRRTKSGRYKLGSRYRYMSALEEKIFGKGGGTGLLLLTDWEVEDYTRLYGTEKERFTIIPPSIVRRDLDLRRKQDQRNKVRQRMDWEEQSQVVLFVGSGFETKGLDRAICAVASASETARLVVAGLGKAAQYQKLARSLGVSDRVVFLSARDDAWELMVAADMLIHPARSENTGTVLVEALSAGTAVICTDRCGFANHVKASGTGCVLPSPFGQVGLDEALRSQLAEPWQPRAEKALDYALSTDLYSGMETAVIKILT